MIGQFWITQTFTGDVIMLAFVLNAGLLNCWMRMVGADAQTEKMKKIFDRD